MRSKLILILIGSMVTTPAQSIAQKAVIACDTEVRAGNKVTLETPLGPAAGFICLDDGDSFSIGPTWLRLRGLDAPEIGRNCLKHVLNPIEVSDVRCLRHGAAVEALAQFSTLLEKGASCQASKKDRYNRWVADCTIEGSKSFAGELIRIGFGCATKEGPDFYRSKGKHDRASTEFGVVSGVECCKAFPRNNAL